MKSILIVAEAFVIGGLETHIRGEIVSLARAGCAVHLATGSRFDPLLLPAEVASVTTGLAISQGATVVEFCRAVGELRRLIRAHAVECVHAHPFTSLAPAFVAAELEAVPFVLTLHGPASLNSYCGPLYDFVLTSNMLPQAGLVVAVSEETAELAAPYLRRGQPVMLPNGVDLGAFAPVAGTCAAFDPRWLVVGRLDSEKIIGIRDFIQKARRAGLPGVRVVGAGPAQGLLEEQLRRDGLVGFAEFLGGRADVPHLMQSAAGVAGMGRVVLEGLASRKPVCLVGYDGTKGLVVGNMLTVAAAANFSGRNLKSIDDETFCSEMAGVSAVDVGELYEVVSDRFSEPVVWADFVDHVRAIEVVPDAQTLLGDAYRSLMANRVEDELPLFGSPVLLATLGRLTHSARYSEQGAPANFRYYEGRMAEMQLLDGRMAALTRAVAERDGQIAILSQAIADRDGQVAQRNGWVADLSSQVSNLKDRVDELDQMVAERDRENARLGRVAADLANDIRSLRESTSWRLTRPVRFAKRFAQSPAAVSADTLRRTYRALPKTARSMLQAPLDGLARWSEPRRSAPRGGSPVVVAPANPPLEQSTPAAAVEPEWLAAVNGATEVVVIPCAFEFDEVVNQRPINAAKYFAARGFQVLYVAWQWSPAEELAKGCRQVWPGIFQVPLYQFLHDVARIRGNRTSSLFAVTFPAPQFRKALDLLRARGFAVLYDIMDDWEAFHAVGQASWFDRRVEESFVLHADYVSAVSASLQHKFGGIRRDIQVVGNGFSPGMVGPDHWLVAARPRAAVKVVGYFGHLTDTWFDWDLVLQAARERDDLCFEIIGYGAPERVVASVSQVPNVRLLGKVHPSELHDHVRAWDAAMIPFRTGPLAEAVDPIKIYEYLYFGLPVVVTGIGHLASYPMTFVAEPDHFADLISTAAMTEFDRDPVGEFLEQCTWDARFDALSRGLGARRLWGLYGD